MPPNNREKIRENKPPRGKKIRNRILAGIATLGIAAGTAVGTDSVCFDAKGVSLLPAEIVKIQEARVCFKSDQDYVTFKDDRVNKYLAKGSEARALYLFSDEGKELVGVLDHEIKKRGVIDLGQVSDGDDVVQLIINKLQQ